VPASNNRALPLLSVVFAAASVGVAYTCNLALYGVWSLIPAEAFAAYQNAHALRFVPIALACGIPNLILAVWLAWRAAPPTPRWALWLGALLALLPWVVTPLYFIPLQGRLAAAGPTPELVGELVSSDLLLRTLPPTLQLALLLWALLGAQRGQIEAPEQLRRDASLQR
jgi:hypothetical protein